MIKHIQKCFRFLKNKKIITTDGFGFSGSGLLNDMITVHKFYAPRNLRLDEFLRQDKTLSWPVMLDKSPPVIMRLRLIFYIFLSMCLRFPINLMQKTFLYTNYLKMRGRTNVMHEQTSVNRSTWSHCVNGLSIILMRSFDQRYFWKWFYAKFLFCFLLDNQGLLLDNGIPRDKRLFSWLYGRKNTFGFYVYRSPRLQFQQIKNYYNSTGRSEPSYREFLEGLISQYEDIVWLTQADYPILFLSCDLLLGSPRYQDLFYDYLLLNGIKLDVRYDVTLSARNNEALKLEIVGMSVPCSEIALEEKVEEFHHLFKEHFESSCKKLKN